MSSRYPFGVTPSGWFAIAWSAELGRTGVLNRRAFGQEWVVFRGESGEVQALAAYCPHLGAHLGHGGRVVGEQLRCPFHGFCFDRSGACQSTPYGGKRPRLHIRALPTQERDGVVLVFHGAPQVPAWPLPENPQHAYGRPVFQSWRIRSHPQEIIENTVDHGHFSAVHGYRGLRPLNPVKTDGPHLRAGYEVIRTQGLFGPWSRPLVMRMAIHASGLGYSRVEVTIPRYGLLIEQIVYPTPIAGELLELRATTRLRLFHGAGGRRAALGRRLLTRFVSLAAARGMARDLAPDIRIWEHKAYLQRPGLAEGDGPIGRFRRWARQFYGHDEMAGTPVVKLAAAGAAP